METRIGDAERFIRLISMVVVGILGCNQCALAQTRELVLPILVTGSVTSRRAYSTDIQILNVGATAAQVTLATYTNQGKLNEAIRFLSNQGTGNSVTIAPGRSEVVFVTTKDSNVMDGWIRLSFGESARIGANGDIMLTNIAEGGPTFESTEIVTNIGVPAVNPTEQFFALGSLLLFEGRRILRHTAYALVNPSSTEAADVALSFSENVEGAETREANVQLQPNSRIAVFLVELFPGVVPEIPITPPRIVNITGTLRMASNAPIAVSAVDVLLPEGKLVNALAAAGAGVK